MGELLEELAKNESLPVGAAKLASELVEVARNHDDSHRAHKHLTDRIHEYKKAQKEGSLGTGTDDKEVASV